MHVSLSDVYLRRSWCRVVSIVHLLNCKYWLLSCIELVAHYRNDWHSSGLRTCVLIGFTFSFSDFRFRSHVLTAYVYLIWPDSWSQFWRTLCSSVLYCNFVYDNVTLLQWLSDTVPVSTYYTMLLFCYSWDWFNVLTDVPSAKALFQLVGYCFGKHS